MNKLSQKLSEVVQIIAEVKKETVMGVCDKLFNVHP